MLIIYDILLFLFALIYLPYAIVKGKFRRDFILRMGVLPKGSMPKGSMPKGSMPKGKIFDRPIWLHAVSVGEMQASKPLLARLRQLYPEKQIVISTITETGNKIARTMAREKDFVFFLPLDVSFIIHRVIRVIQPSICIIMETEIWPNLIAGLKASGAPVVIVNARISDKSVGRYRMARAFVRPVLRAVSHICVQSSKDAERFSMLGAEASKISITGNMKYDTVIRDTADSILKSYLRLATSQQLIVAGSTHPGEEEIILDCYKEVIKRLPATKLLIAPRHPDRSVEIAALVERAGFKAALVSQLVSESTNGSEKVSVFILDTIGQLASLYQLATVVFIGGSLVPIGGHNIIEPAYFKKPIIIGPHMQNFKDVRNTFMKYKALVEVHTSEELRDALVELLSDGARRAELGSNAFSIISSNQGTTEKSIAVIRGFLHE